MYKKFNQIQKLEIAANAIDNDSPIFVHPDILLTGQWFSPSTPVSSTNKTDRHDGHS
jgi:hypothetical protein